MFALSFYWWSNGGYPWPMQFGLHLSYNHIFFYKPCISRLSNSEKYIVCSDFKGYNKDIVNKMIHHFDKDIKLDIELDLDFRNIIYNYNRLYSSIQIGQINEGIDLIKNKKIRKYPSKEQINYATEWCKKYNVPINQQCFYLKRAIS